MSSAAWGSQRGTMGPTHNNQQMMPNGGFGGGMGAYQMNPEPDWRLPPMPPMPPLPQGLGNFGMPAAPTGDPMAAGRQAGHSRVPSGMNSSMGASATGDSWLLQHQEQEARRSWTGEV